MHSNIPNKGAGKKLAALQVGLPMMSMDRRGGRIDTVRG
jgi:hypothetical protein